MAEAAVSFVVEKLSNLLIGEANLLQEVDEEITLLKSEMEWMSLFIKNADAKRRSDPEVKLMVKQIRELTFKAEDVIDEFILKIYQDRGRQRADSSNRCTRSVKTIMSCTSGIQHLPLRHELGNQIKAINKMSEKITSNKSKYCIEGGSSNDVMSRQKVMRGPIADDQGVVGIEDSTKQVISLLLLGSGGDGRRRRVVTIVGMGGLGKTTLAKKVYNNSVVKRNFDCFAWVSVSQEYRLKYLLQSIIKECGTTVSKEELEKLNEEELSNKLSEYLLQGNKKYLIVLDDIWDLQAWNVLNISFPDQMNGSRILLTTRNKNVGMHADSSSNHIHELRFLNEQESWELFVNKVFALRGESSSAEDSSKCPLELEEVAKEMVGKCGGLPLAILVLGGLLSCKDKTFINWSKVNTNFNWHLTHGAGSNSCSGILALSYYDLPYYLKPLFLYIGLFPEDYKISATRLFQCWIAEGFVQSRGSEETLEDIAEEYLEELIHRSMIQVGGLRRDGRVKTCRVHDLLRDLAIAESKEDQFSQVIENLVDISKSNNVRRLTIHGGQVGGFNVEQQCFSQSANARSVRALMCFGKEFKNEQFLASTSRCFKLLKVLDVGLYGRTETVRLPEEIGELIHLEYLHLECFDGKHVCLCIPNSFSKLVNLQTLDFSLTILVKGLPSQFLSLHQLRHLRVRIIDATPSLGFRILDSVMCSNDFRSPHFHLDHLTNLQSLSLLFWKSGVISIGRLDRLRMLKKLEISLPQLQDQEIYNDMANLTGLRSLSLFADGFPAVTQFSGHSYLTKLCLHGRLSSEFLFPPNLISLLLASTKIETDGMVQVLANLQNLKFLKLLGDAFMGKKMVLPQGGFLRLQVLELQWAHILEELIVEEGALISLTRFEIDGCKKLKMLPDGLRQLSKLEKLSIVGMPKEFIDRLSSENEGEDWDKIKHIPNLNLHWVDL